MNDVAWDFPPLEAYFQTAEKLRSLLAACCLCPRTCGADRLKGQTGFCRAGAAAAVNLAQLHYGEEPPISGRRGSGTVFFSHCTLSCQFCQNWTISQEDHGRLTSSYELSRIFLDLQHKGAHNINLVTPTPHLAAIMEALALARQDGLRLPVVYNTSGYERAQTLALLRGLVEIYMPDCKYGRNDPGRRLSQAEDYADQAYAAIREMYDQVGNLALDEQGIARRGLLVRHLVLPHGLADSQLVFNRLVDIAGPEVWVSMMSQYTPLYKARHNRLLARRLLPEEYGQAVAALEEAGIENGFVQELASAGAEYIPDFEE